MDAKHINAHFLICFIALTIIRLMQYKTLKNQGKDTLNMNGWEQGITPERIRESLNTFNMNHIRDGYYQTSRTTPEEEKILTVFNIQEEMSLPDIGNISSYKDKTASVNL